MSGAGSAPRPVVGRCIVKYLNASSANLWVISACTTHGVAPRCAQISSARNLSKLYTEKDCQEILYD